MSKTVLVTGASGFLASYVIDAFLQAGWNVRGTVRSLAKAQHLLDRYPEHSDKLKLVEVKDIVTGEGLKEALEGCDAVAHTASPYHLHVSDPMKDFIAPAVDGTLSVLKAAKAAGIKRVVVTSSFAAVTNFEKGGPWRDYTYTDATPSGRHKTLLTSIALPQADWNPTTLEQAIEPGRPASKTLAEQAAHDFGTANPDMVIVTLNPPMIYSPPLQSISSASEVNTSSNAIYSLINGEEGREAPWNRLPLFVATEDVALAHVRALEVGEEKVKGKRFLLCGGSFTWEDASLPHCLRSSATSLTLLCDPQAIRHLQTARPQLSSRLPKLPATDKDADKPIARLDCTPAKEVLGIHEFKPWQDVLERTIDRLVEVEKGFKN
ncbi:SPOSA6832_00436, partial [Sporobolomyces salmonicolor]